MSLGHLLCFLNLSLQLLLELPSLLSHLLHLLLELVDGLIFVFELLALAFHLSQDLIVLIRKQALLELLVLDLLLELRDLKFESLRCLLLLL